MDTKTCTCRFCSYHSPKIDRISAVLSEDLKKDFNEIIGEWLNEGQDHDVARAKLNGEWPGWEEMKNFKPKF